MPVGTDHPPPKTLAAFALTIGALLPSSCTTAPRPGPAVTIHAPVPAPLAAWACAEVLRAEAPGADPRPWHAGALATAHADAFTVAGSRDRSGRWRSSGNVRLLPVADPGGALVIQVEPASRTDVAPGGTDRHCEIQPASEHASRIELRAEADDLARIHRHLEQLLSTLDVMAGRRPIPPATGCCVQHAGWTARAWLLAATRHRAAGDLDTALAAARTAAALAPDLADSWQSLGALTHTVTTDQTAAHAPLAAMLLASDPVERANCTRTLAAAEVPRQSPATGDAMRALADDLLHQGEVAAARRVRANAMALHPDIVADLHLRLHAAENGADHRRTLESLLLLREYGASGTRRELVLGYATAKLPELAQRCLDVPASAIPATIARAQGWLPDTVAAPPR